MLRDLTVEAAVLETARGGILRRGLATDRTDVAIVTNISPDHFGEYGIDDLDGLADVKLSVAHLLDDDGLLVLNAGDALLAAKSEALDRRFGWQPPLAWFARDYEHPRLAQHRIDGGTTCGVRAGRLCLSHAGAEHDLGAIDAMPLTVAGTATYNVENLAGAAIVAAKLGVAPATVAGVFASFGLDLADNAGRLMRFDVGGVSVVLDYAHNPDGLRGVMGVAQRLRAPGGRIGMLLGHAGNRLNADIEELAVVASEFSPDLVVVKEDEGHLRGRQPGEVPAILQNALLKVGMTASAVPICPSEVDAALMALAWARPGDALVLLIHSSPARARMLEILRERCERLKPAAAQRPDAVAATTGHGRITPARLQQFLGQLAQRQHGARGPRARTQAGHRAPGVTEQARLQAGDRVQRGRLEQVDAPAAETGRGRTGRRRAVHRTHVTAEDLDGMGEPGARERLVQAVAGEHRVVVLRGLPAYRPDHEPFGAAKIADTGTGDGLGVQRRGRLHAGRRVEGHAESFL